MALDPTTADGVREIITLLETQGLATVYSGTTFQFRSVTYRTVEEITAAIAYWNGKLRALVGGSKQTLVVGSKGFGPARWF